MVLFTKTFGCCRKVWNLMLADKMQFYKETKSFGKQTPAKYKGEYPYLKEVDSLASTIGVPRTEQIANAIELD